MRAGETLETALRSVVKDSKMGKILIQTNEVTQVPELYFLRLPKNVNKHKVFLMDATVATGKNNKFQNTFSYMKFLIQDHVQ